MSRSGTKSRHVPLRDYARVGGCVACALLVVLIASCASTGDMSAYPGTPPVFQKVITVQGQTVGNIYSRTLRWTSDTFVSAKDAIEIQDKESGLIAVRTSFQSVSYTLGAIAGGTYYITYKVKIEMQEGRVRITCDNPIFEYNSRGSSGQIARPLTGMVNEYIDKANKLIANYESYIGTASASW